VFVGKEVGQCGHLQGGMVVCSLALYYPTSVCVCARTQPFLCALE
jgi:hypothetical protein